MSSLKESLENLKFDARMTDINMKSQALNQAEWQKYLDKLPDLQSNCEPLEFEREARESWSN